MCRTHTIRYATDNETYADYFPEDDCCEEFLDLYGDTFMVNDKEDGIDGYYEVFGESGDGWNELVKPVRYCPFCGAKIIVKKE